MLYSLIPPILIVLSLIGIILFLVKKSDKVAGVSIEEILREEEERRITMGDAGFFKKTGLRAKNIKWDDVKHFLLGLMEGITRRLRVIFLKLESKSGSLSAKIRNKRKERAEKRAALADSRQSEGVFRKIREYKPKRFKRPENEFISFKEEEGAGEEAVKKTMVFEVPAEPAKIASEDEKEKIIKPIISENVVKPRKTEMKDRLEELLIERIAVNPKDIEAYERLGQYYMEIKSHEDARECFRQVIKLDPENRNAKYKLKRLEDMPAQ